MCRYCNNDEPDCMYFKDPLDNQWYMEVETSEWDYYNDSFAVERSYGVKYCTYCGRTLDE